MKCSDAELRVVRYLGQFPDVVIDQGFCADGLGQINLRVHHSDGQPQWVGAMAFRGDFCYLILARSTLVLMLSRIDESSLQRLLVSVLQDDQQVLEKCDATTGVIARYHGGEWLDTAWELKKKRLAECGWQQLGDDDNSLLQRAWIEQAGLRMGAIPAAQNGPDSAAWKCAALRGENGVPGELEIQSRRELLRVFSSLMNAEQRLLVLNVNHNSYGACVADLIARSQVDDGTEWPVDVLPSHVYLVFCDRVMSWWILIDPSGCSLTASGAEIVAALKQHPLSCFFERIR